MKKTQLNPLKIAVPKETVAFERRVAATPETVKKLVAQGFSVYVEKDAGASAAYADQAYAQAGAVIAASPRETYEQAKLVLKLQPPQGSGEEGTESALIPEGSTLVGLFGGLYGKDRLPFYQKKKWRVFSLELIPRISRAQAMDVLSSQMNLAGYRAVIEAAALTQRVFPMMMTAGGTIPPVQVLVLGAGVAGLQAIATAKRLGARVMAFDIRPAVKEQVESLGAQFVDVPAPVSGEDAGGYATEMDAAYQKRQQEKLAEVLQKVDVVICSALVPGKAPPVLVTEPLLKILKPGAIVIDLASGPLGGNCFGSVQDQLLTTAGGVQILGARALETRLATDASSLYARNVYHFLQLLWDSETKVIKETLDDPILQATCLASALEETQ
ncbi:MAG: NAD(P) transhydrogenase subunit alpha [Alphaproteobacteria bacterium]